MMKRAVGSLRRSLHSLHLGEDCRSWNSGVKVGANYYATKATKIGFGHDFYNGMVHEQAHHPSGTKMKIISEEDRQASDQNPLAPQRMQQAVRNISAADKRKFLVNTLLDLKNSKQAVYGTLDAWVAWEHSFPLASLKRALLVLEKEEQWHRIVQVLKWMLSKGQGTTMGTYEQLIRALEKDNRAEEAHIIWMKKISYDLHSVPWRFCDLMISIYYRNNMLERLVKLFKGLESYDRKPPGKSIIRKVADAYELLGSSEEKSRLLEKYSNLFSESSKERFRKSGKNAKKAGKKKCRSKEATKDAPFDSGPSDVETDS